MWIKKEEYESLKEKALKLEDAKIGFASKIEIYKIKAEMSKQTCNIVFKKLCEIKKDLECYLNTNEENGVVYIPKSVVEKIVYGNRENGIKALRKRRFFDWEKEWKINMKMEEIIDKVSELYREERKGINELETELLQIVRNLNEAYLDEGKNITLAEFTSLSERKNYLEKEIKLKAEHCEGISAVREMLMDLGFDTEVKK